MVDVDKPLVVLVLVLALVIESGLVNVVAANLSDCGAALFACREWISGEPWSARCVLILEYSGPDADTALAVYEDICDPVAVGIAQKGPIPQIFRKCGSPIRPVMVGQGGFRHIGCAALESEYAVSASIKYEEVNYAISIEIGSGKLGRRQSSGPWIGHRTAVEPKDRDGIPSSKGSGSLAMDLTEQPCKPYQEQCE